VTGYPAVELAGAPWVRFVSANPLEMRDPALPPVLSGLPVDDPSDWPAFRDEYHRAHVDLLSEHNDFRVASGVEPCPLDEFNTNSPWLNLFLFPEAADYPRSQPLGPTWHRLSSTVRTSEVPFDVNEHLPGEGKVVYLSLGSLGCMDVGLMQRLIDAMGRTEHRTIVSMGPLKDQMTLPPNVYGESFLPQPSILPQCDLLITHGGNNTMCEGFHFGLPMIGLPLFWDQYDNAQRLQETGFGLRLSTYDWEDDQLIGAVDRLIGDEALRARMRNVAATVRADPGPEKGASLIERVAATGESVTR
jgi:MGT family glycosyltransferase